MNDHQRPKKKKNPNKRSSASERRSRETARRKSRTASDLTEGRHYTESSLYGTAKKTRNTKKSGPQPKRRASRNTPSSSKRSSGKQKSAPKDRHPRKRQKTAPKKAQIVKGAFFAAGLLLVAVLIYVGIGTVREHKLLSDNIAVLTEMEKTDPAKLLADEIKGGIHVKDFPAEENKIISLDPESVDRTDLLRKFKNKVILGDSLAKACTGYGYLNDYIVYAEVGVSLSNADALFEAAKNAAPSVIFLCFGINDIQSYGERSDLFIKEYTKRITDLKKELPYTVIYVQGILPPASASENDSYQYRGTYNEELEKICNELGVYYFNADFILEDLPSLYDVDGLHPKGDFYPLWLTYLADIAGL